MRKLKLQTQVTADGYMGGPNGELDWMAVPWTDDLNDHMDALTESVDCILMGRKLAEGFIPYWASGPTTETKETVDWMNNTPKVVFSRTLTQSPWDNATVENGDLVQAVEGLKAQDGADLIVYGGSTFVRSLIEKGLIDELHLFVNPTAIGGGLPVFPSGAYQKLRLAGARSFDCGIVDMTFEPRRD